MQNKVRQNEIPLRLQKRVMRELANAIDQSLRWHRNAITPRAYVELRTMSQFELGLRFKAALRDELYERRREKGRRVPAKFEVEERLAFLSTSQGRGSRDRLP